MREPDDDLVSVRLHRRRRGRAALVSPVKPHDQPRRPSAGEPGLATGPAETSRESPTRQRGHRPPVLEPRRRNWPRLRLPNRKSLAHRLRTRSGRWLAAGGVVVGVLVFGWTLGQASTERPAIELGYLRQDTVHLWSSNPDATLNFTWVTHANGQVSILLYGISPTGEPVDALLVLQCDARLKSFDNDTADVVFTEAELGAQPSDCNFGGSGDRVDESPVQVFKIRFQGTNDLGDGSTIGRFQIWGMAERSWSAEAAGVRVSYAPYVYVAGQARRDYGQSFELRDPAAARIESVLLGSATEALDSHFPPNVQPPDFMHADGQVQADMRQDSFQREGSQVRWSASWSALEMRPQGPRIPYYNHTNAMARWSDPSGLADAQLQLLLAGLLLGIGGSVAVEALFMWARAARKEESTRSSPADTAPGGGP
jgi:hypothetical protein